MQQLLTSAARAELMAPVRTYKYLDLSGYAFTGKHAVIDLMREFRGYIVPHFQFEFNLLRIQGGIRDLETALVDDWSPIRADAAVRRFRRLIRRFGGKNSYFRPSSWFSAVGWNYDEFFRGRFTPLSEQYLAGLIKASWRADWPYPRAEISGPELFCRKLLKLLGFKSAMDFEIFLAAPDNFLDLTRTYLNGLMAAFADGTKDARTIVMHNSFEPFNPARAIRYFHEARAIIVDRDPRDSYVACLPHRHVALPVPEFVTRYRLCRQLANRHGPDAPNVLRIRFEELVLEYEAALARILGFLGESASNHVRPKKYFDPAVSIKNIGIWKSHEKQAEIEMIYRELREFCYE